MYPPNSQLMRVTDASVEPLTVAEAKQFLRLEVDDDDALIADLITTARQKCEQINDRTFVATTWRLTFGSLPQTFGLFGGYLPSPAFGGWGWGCGGYNPREWSGSVYLPRPPLIGLTSINYINQSGVSTALDVSTGSTALILSPGTPGFLSPPYLGSFPWGRDQPQGASIVYGAGYGTTAADVPATVKTAIRFLVATMYENRTSDVAVPAIVEDLLQATAWGGYA